MESEIAAKVYPQMRRRLIFIRLQQWARYACDLTGLGPSAVGRLCCVLILGTILFAAILILSFLLKFSPTAAFTTGFTIFLVVLLSGSALILQGGDEDIAAHRDQLLEELPQANLAWLAYKKRRREERAAERERLRKDKADRFYAKSLLTGGEVWLPGTGNYELDIVGESHHQKQLEKICGGRSETSARFETKAVLVLENNNKHDSKAVRVEIDGYLVGHLSREDAREYRKKLKQAGHPNSTASCSALIVGGWYRGKDDQGHFGVRLDLPLDMD